MEVGKITKSKGSLPKDTQQLDHLLVGEVQV